MPNVRWLVSRRGFLTTVAGSVGVLAGGDLLAEELALTPRQGEGPFYPDRLPLDTDNDLIIVNEHLTPALGEITHLTGKVLTESGSPVRNAVVEIWQADQHGAYLHTAGAPRDKRDANFQGFGRFLTNSKGEYYFRTIKPVAYSGRAPHIHFAVEHRNQRVLTTQCYVRGEPLNERDGIFLHLRDPKIRELLLVDFNPLPKSRIGERTANFDIVLGLTPEDA